MVDGLLADLLAYMLQRSELIAVLLSRLVLECIRVHRVKTKTMLHSQGLDGGGILGYIPGYMQRYGPAAAIQGMQQSDVFHFLFQAARLSSTGKPSKAGAPCSQRPAGNGYLKVDQLLQDTFRISDTLCNELELPLMLFLQGLVMLAYLIFFYL